MLNYAGTFIINSYGPRYSLCSMQQWDVVAFPIRRLFAQDDPRSAPCLLRAYSERSLRKKTEYVGVLYIQEHTRHTHTDDIVD